MSTRHEKIAGPISQERYMSSNEFAELRGISGIAVSARAAVMLHSRKRNLVWFIQGMSLAEGGLKRMARELLAMFPDRIGTPAMHAAGVKADDIYPRELLCDVESELHTRPRLLNLAEGPATLPPVPPVEGSKLIGVCRMVALHHREKEEREGRRTLLNSIPSLEEFLIDLCINPRLYFPAPGEEIDASDIESDSAMDANPELSAHEFKTARLPYFRDIIGTLFEYQTRIEARAVETFQQTTISKQIWETLDFALKSRSMVVLDGLEGRGKTESVKAWCALHQDQARFVSLKGVSNKTTIFREIAKALGIASSYARTALEMQARIEDVLKQSKIMLVMDEAHFLFSQARRMNSRPELIDWIDTAICNSGVPIALVTTPQFMKCMTRAADQVEWNYKQFRRRCKRWIKLPAVNTEADIRAVAGRVFQTADPAALKKITGYALLSKRDLSAVGDVALEVQDLIGTDDLSKATAEQIARVIFERLLPSDQTFLEGMAEVRQATRKGRPARMPRPAPTLPDIAADEADEGERVSDADRRHREPLPAPRRAEIKAPASSRRDGNLITANAPLNAH